MASLEPAIQWIAGTMQVPPWWVLGVGTALVGIALGWGLRAIILRFAIPLATHTRTEMDDFILRTSATPLGLTLALIGVLRGARYVWPNPAQDAAFDRIFITGMIIIWGAAVAQLVGHTLRHATRHLGARAQVRGSRLLNRLAKIAVTIIIILMLFSVWDVDVTPLLASAGLVGIALALAAQDTLSNFFAGIAVYLDRLYEVGDYVVLDQGSAGQIRGEVRDIGLRSTRILTRDDVLVTVPNAIIANGRVVNETGTSTQYRIRVGTAVAYSSDLDHVETVLTQIGGTHPLVLADPAPRARVRSFDDSGIAVELLAWIRDPRDRGLVRHELAKSLHRRFREENIQIPFPQQDLHVKEWPPREPHARGEEAPDDQR